MRIETKVVIGVVSFFGLLLLLGWVAINEEGRMNEFTVQYEARSIERGAIIFESNCQTCHGIHGQGIPGRAPSLNNPRLFNGERLEEMRWTGSLDDYLTNAVSAGRPNSGSYWNNNVMPTWGQSFGGPMRADEVQDVVRYIKNWEGVAMDEENPPLVLQDFVLPSTGPAAAEAGGGETGGEIDIVAFVDGLPEGDHTSGAELYLNLGCTGCHLAGAIAPITELTYNRAQDRVATAPELAGYTPEQYLVESIIMPNAYIVPDNPSYQTADGASLMPGNFRDLLSDQDVADLLAYLQEQHD